MTYSGFMGIKYLITDKMGIFSEFGFGMSLMKFGATFKL